MRVAPALKTSVVSNGTDALPLVTPLLLPAGACSTKLAWVTAGDRVALGNARQGRRPRPGRRLRTPRRTLRGRVEGRLLELAVAAEVEGVVEVARLIEEGAVQPAVGIVGRVGRRRVRVALGGQDRVGLGQAAVGQRARQERVLDVVGPGVDDVAVGDDREAGHERAAGHAVAAHVVLAVGAVGLQVLVVGQASGSRGCSRGLVAEEFAVELVAVDVEDPGVDAVGLELVGM